MAFLVDQNGPSLPSGMPVTAAFNSGVTVSGGTTTDTLSATGAVSMSGAAAFTGTTAGVKSTPITGTADVVLTAAQSGATVLCTKASGNQLVTLPAAAAGLVFTVICGNVLTGMTIKPGDATAVIHAKNRTAGADGTAIVSTASTGSIVNTQGTAVLGDNITVWCDGTNFWARSQSGVFAAT